MKWLRWIGIFLVAVVALVAIIAFTLYTLGGRKLARKVSVTLGPIEIPTDSTSIAEGRRYVKIFLCVDCHGSRLEGRVLVDDPVFGRLVPPHIAPGAGSVTANFTAEDWIRAIRHGVGGDGRPLVVMPSSDYNGALSATDLANIVAYLQHADPVDNTPPRTQLKLAQVMLGAGAFRFEFDQIDHSKPAPPKPSAEDTLGTGKYFARICQGCHGESLMGGQDPDMGGPPLAQGGVLEAYDEERFIRVFRTGVAQNGRNLDAERMPWKFLGAMTEPELHAVWTYIRTVPATTP